MRRRLSGRDRQRLRDLARVQQPLLARALLRRCGRAHPPSPVRRGRVRRVRADDSAAADRGRRRRRRPRPGRASRRRAPRRPPTGRPAIARDLPRLRARRALRVAGRRTRRTSAAPIRVPGAADAQPLGPGGDWTSSESARARTSRTGASRSASTPATCISSWGRGARQPRCASACRSTARRRAMRTAPTSTSRATAR